MLDELNISSNESTSVYQKQSKQKVPPTIIKLNENDNDNESTGNNNYSFNNLYPGLGTIKDQTTIIKSDDTNKIITDDTNKITMDIPSSETKVSDTNIPYLSSISENTTETSFDINSKVMKEIGSLEKNENEDDTITLDNFFNDVQDMTNDKSPRKPKLYTLFEDAEKTDV